MEIITPDNPNFKQPNKSITSRPEPEPVKKSFFATHRIAIVVILVCIIAAVGGAAIYAYLADQEEVTNSMSLVENSVEIVEEFVPPKRLEPGLQGDSAIPKKVQIQNTDTAETYVRVFCDFNNKKVEDFAWLDYNTEDWVYDDTEGYWYYKYPLIDTTDTIAKLTYQDFNNGVEGEGGITSPLITKIQTKDADEVERDDMFDFEVIVMCESVQARSGINGELYSPKEAWKEFGIEDCPIED